MLKYAVCEIAGQQIRVEPDRAVLVGYLGSIKALECDRVLLLVEDGHLKIGNPYLKQTLKFEVGKATKTKKIRVATYHAKSNTRRVRGAKNLSSTIRLVS